MKKYIKFYNYRTKRRILYGYQSLFTFINKSLDICISFCRDFSGIYLNFNWSRNCDHAGITLELNFGLVCFEINFNDNRHWNFKKNTWNNEEDYKKEKDNCDNKTECVEFHTYEVIGEVYTNTNKFNVENTREQLTKVLDKYFNRIN